MFLAIVQHQRCVLVLFQRAVPALPLPPVNATSGRLVPVPVTPQGIAVIAILEKYLKVVAVHVIVLPVVAHAISTLGTFLALRVAHATVQMLVVVATLVGLRRVPLALCATLAQIFATSIVELFLLLVIKFVAIENPATLILAA